MNLRYATSTSTLPAQVDQKGSGFLVGFYIYIYIYILGRKTTKFSSLNIRTQREIQVKSSKGMQT